MNQTNHDEQQEIQPCEPVSLLPMIILSAIIGFVPMVVYMRVVNFDDAMQAIFGRINEGEFFSYYKSVWLYILTGTGLCWFLVNTRARNSWYHKPLAIYSFFAILSTAFAQFRLMALWGDPYRHEGLVAQLCYMAIVFLFMHLTKGQRELKFLLNALLISATILATVGTLQFFGYDYFSSSYSSDLLIPGYLREAMPYINLSNMRNSMNSVYLTFGNGNFTGSYMAMLFSLTFVLCILLPTRWKRILLPLHLMIVVCLLGSKSRAGQYGSMLACISALIFMHRRVRENVRFIMLLLLAYLLMPFIMDAHTLNSEKPRFLETSLNRSLVVKSGLFGNFQSLSIKKDEIKTTFDGVELAIRFNDEKIEFYDGKGNLVSHRLIANSSDQNENLMATDLTGRTINNTFSTSMMSKLATGKVMHIIPVSENADEPQPKTGKSEEYLVVFPEKQLRGFIINAWPDYNLLRIGRGGVSFFVAYLQNGFTLLNQFFMPVTIRDVPVLGFKGWERFASNRGYIWSRSLPMLKRTLLIGFGPDTFAAHFPNHDYIGKLKVWATGIFLMIEKPHNMYLQIALNTGIPSLLAFLALLLKYGLTSFKLYRQNKFQNFSEIAGLAIFIALFSYLLTGIFNDSINGVAPVFWSLLGLGIATNNINLGRQAQASHDKEQIANAE